MTAVAIDFVPTALHPVFSVNAEEKDEEGQKEEGCKNDFQHAVNVFRYLFYVQR